MLRRLRPRLVHYSFMGSLPPDAAARPLWGWPQYLVSDQASSPRSAGSAPRPLAWRLLHLAKARLVGAGIRHFIAHSRFVERRLRRESLVPAAKLSLLYNPVNLDRFRPADAGERNRAKLELMGLAPGVRLVVFVGQIAEYKGIPQLLEAAPGVLAAHPEAVLALIGEGPLDSRVAQAAAREPRLLHLGRRPQVEHYLRAADLATFPSQWQEALGMSLAEAACCGLPLVATATGGIPELVRHGRTGLLVPPDDPAALGRALSRLLADDGLRDGMGRQAARVGRRMFDLHKVVAQTVELYTSLLNRRP